MRILADENFPGLAVAALRQQGHDVRWVRTEAPGMSDAEVLTWAVSEGRTIVTFDKDFGELVFRVKLTIPSGIILFRMIGAPTEVVDRVLAAISLREDWSRLFAVVEAERIRIKSLPKPGS